MTPELLGTNHQTEKVAEAVQTEQVEAVLLETDPRTVAAVVARDGVIAAEDESPGSVDSGGCTHEDEGPGTPNVDGRVVEACT